jgi:hypothetical protein
MKIGTLVCVWMEGDSKSKVVGEIISLDPELRVKNAFGREATLFPTRDTITVLTDGEAMLWKLENA